MRVGLDMQLALGTATGIGEYVRGLAPALSAAGVDVVPLRCAALDPWRFDRRVIWDQVLLPLAAARERLDVLHCAAGTMPLAAPVPIVVTVHDVAWLRVQGHARPYARAYFGAFALARYRRAARLIVDSRFSRRELAELGGFAESSVSVVYPGVAAEFAAIARRASPEEAPRTILAVGTVERRKNLAVVIRALREVPGARLVSVGPPTPYRAECERLARETGTADRVVFRGYVSRDELLELYATAAVAVCPSTYEGFGYGVAQALCAGLPVLAADRASLPEVADGDAPLLDPDDAAAWRDALVAALAPGGRTEAAAAAARPRAIERFGVATAAQAAAAVYAAAL